MAECGHGLLDDRSPDPSIPQLKQIRARPSLEKIVLVVGEHFDRDTQMWSPGRRSDDASRAVAAYLTRRCFEYPAREVAEVLGYRRASSIPRAVSRIESGNQRPQRTAKS